MGESEMAEAIGIAIEPPVRDPLRAAFEDHYEVVLRLCALLSGRPEVAEDLAQEAFVRAASRIPRVDQEQMRRYLVRTAVNLWKNRLRRLAVERRVRPSVRQEAHESPPPFEDREDLWQAVLRLPDRQRACLVLRYYEDLTERAAAEVLGCPIGSVKSHTSRALARLRKELGYED